MSYLLSRKVAKCKHRIDLERMARKFGHEINIKKTKAKHDADSIMIPVEDVDSFCYRGSIVATYGEVHKYLEELLSE